MQINATLVKGKARVQFGANKVTAVTAPTIPLVLVNAPLKLVKLVKKMLIWDVETCKLVKTLIRKAILSIIKINNVISMISSLN